MTDLFDRLGARAGGVAVTGVAPARPRPGLRFEAAAINTGGFVETDDWKVSSARPGPHPISLSRALEPVPGKMDEAAEAAPPGPKAAPAGSPVQPDPESAPAAEPSAPTGTARSVIADVTPVRSPAPVAGTYFVQPHPQHRDELAEPARAIPPEQAKPRPVFTPVASADLPPPVAAAVPPGREDAATSVASPADRPLAATSAAEPAAPPQPSPVHVSIGRIMVDWSDPPAPPSERTPAWQPPPRPPAPAPTRGFDAIAAARRGTLR